MFKSKKKLFFLYFLSINFLCAADFSNYDGRNFDKRTTVILNNKIIGVIAYINSNDAPIVGQAIKYGDFIYLNGVNIAQYGSVMPYQGYYPFMLIGLTDFENREKMAMYEIAFCLIEQAFNDFPIANNFLNVDIGHIKFLRKNLYYIDKMKDTDFNRGVLDLNRLDLTNLMFRVMEYKVILGEK